MGHFGLRKVSFISGTRADYGKIKPYIEFLLKDGQTEVFVFITGMHVLPGYGDTCAMIEKDLGNACALIVDKAFVSVGTAAETAHVMAAYDNHLRADKIDFVFTHGDRPEALAAALAAVLNNIPVAHIEAGDLSGSIDESLRHAISKLSHKFFVADERARRVLLQLGECDSDIFVVGTSSLANTCCVDKTVLKQYGIAFDRYGVLMYHPVTTMSSEAVRVEIDNILKKLDESGENIVAIYPNNDLNRDVIVAAYEKYKTHPRFQFFTSFPFDVFTNIMAHARFLVGNSSCGVKEAPFYHVPTIDIGMRQQKRYEHLKLSTFYHLETPDGLGDLLKTIPDMVPATPDNAFRKLFFENLAAAFTEKFWQPNIQKQIRLNFKQ